MSWANKAVRAFQKFGYTVDVKTPVTGVNNWSHYNSDIMIKSLKKGERIPVSAGKMLAYYKEQPVILTAQLSEIEENLPKEYDARHAKSGGSFNIYPDGTFSFSLPSVTLEAVKVILEAGYKFRKS